MRNFQIGYLENDSEITDIKDIDSNNRIQVMSAINDFAGKYAFADVEYALEISPTGKAYTIKGIRGNVNSEILGKDILLGSISIHNHPVTQGEIMGDSFSKQDLGFSVEYKAGRQYLVSGERRNAFEYKGNNTTIEIYNMYDEAYNKLLEKSFDKQIEIIWEKEQTLKILSEILKGFRFYENF